MVCDLCRNVMYSVCAGVSRSEAQRLKNVDRKIICSCFKLQLRNLEDLTTLVNNQGSEIYVLQKKSTTNTEQNLAGTEMVIQKRNGERRTHFI